MPTKMNKAGNQQNYVPAGNGDASGEYGDNATGSNVHFTNFAKPDEKVQVTAEDSNTPTKEEMIEIAKQYLIDEVDRKHEYHDEYWRKMFIKGALNKSEKEFLEVYYNLHPEHKPHYNTFNEFIDQVNVKGGKKVNEKIKTLYGYGQKEGKDLVNKLVNNATITYTGEDNGNSYFSARDKFVNLLPSDLENEESSSYTDGEVFYHENGHAIDCIFRQEESSEERPIYQFASCTFKTSTGKTLRETLSGRQKPPIKERLEEASKDHEKYISDFMAKNYPDVEEKEKRLNAIEEEAKNTPEYKEIEQQRLKNPYSQEDGALFRKQINIVNNYKKDEQIEIRKDLATARTEANSSTRRAFGDVSDMFCMHGYGFVFGMGHPSTYSKDLDNRAEEFFAECFSAENTNPESLKRIKKYFPEGYKAYREIIEAIKSDKLRSKK